MIRKGLILLISYFVLCLTFTQGAEEVHGLPFIRSYALDEIGKVPRTARLGFDAHGRFAVMYDGLYTVLNDTVWIERIDPAPENRILMSIVHPANGVYYYGGRATWGIAERTDEGYLRPRSLVPAGAPSWTELTSFSQMLTTDEGAYFFGLGGLVHWDFAQKRNSFFEHPRLSTCFKLGQRVFVSDEDRHLYEIIPDDSSMRTHSVPGMEDVVVRGSVQLNALHTLLLSQDGRLLVFDGKEARSWPPQEAANLGYRITSIAGLAEGGVAICVRDKGLFVLATDGTIRLRIPQPEFRLVGAMASNEPGVVWAMGESAVYKVFYNSPISSLGPLMGLTISWPNIVSWNDRLLVSSGKTLYTSVSNGPSAPSNFQVMPGLPEGQVGALATLGDHLLVADKSAVYAADKNGNFTKVLSLHNAVKLVPYDEDTLIAIGSQEIAAIRLLRGSWTECAPRISGVGETPIRTLMKRALWIELGGDKVAQLSLAENVLHWKQVPLPWKGEQWTNLGAVGTTIILSSAKGSRAYYDEETQSFIQSPTLDALLGRSPYWIARVVEGDKGMLWATHTRGVVTFTPNGKGYDMDSTTFELLNDSYPEVVILPDRTIWFRSARSLYRVERDANQPARPVELKLVSLLAMGGRREMVDALGQLPSRLEFDHDDNNLSFRFFSGTYAWRSSPLYEYRIEVGEKWTAFDGGTMLHFPKLRDGDYKLEIRPAGMESARTAFTLAFSISPPWFRTPLASVLGGAAIVISLVAIVRWSNRRSLRRNAELERLVGDRTRELEATMTRLNEETRNAATLAERSRLAGEIHDSLQQGLSGSLLHLETTLSNPTLAPDLRSQLGVMRNMLSYTREEVQQAVWNLESPLLQNSTLSGALRLLVSYLNPSSTGIRISITNDPVDLSAEVQHNLLRIAQEAITNSVKHASAGNIEVCLEANPAAVALSVRDDGRGFDPDQQGRAEGHFGLRGIHLRCRAIGATPRIESSPGKGTHITVTVPRTPPPQS